MAKTVDYIALTVIIFMLTLVWSAIAFGNFIGAIIFSCALSVAITFSVKYFSKNKKRPYSYDRLALELSVEGSGYLINLIRSTIKNDKIESGFDYILFDDSILIAAFRFNLLNVNDLGNIYRTSLKHNKKRIFVMTRGVDRRAYQALALKDIHISVIKIRQIYAYLKRCDALPDLKPVKHKFSPSRFGEMVLQRSNLKHYLFTGAVLISVAFITPLRIYYLVFGSISLLLALLTLTPIGKGHFRSSTIFDEIDKMNERFISNATSNEQDNLSVDSDSGDNSGKDKPDK